MKAKDAGLRIRIDKELREQFLESCRNQDKPAAQVLREFMRDYVASHPLPRLKSSHPPRKHRKSG